MGCLFQKKEQIILYKKRAAMQRLNKINEVKFIFFF